MCWRSRSAAASASPRSSASITCVCSLNDAAIRFLTDRGADHITCICLLVAPEGVANLEAGLAGLDVPVTVVTAALDDRLDERGYIVPGLGDAGDRLYGLAH